jgi:hypothetical protein
VTVRSPVFATVQGSKAFWAIFFHRPGAWVAGMTHKFPAKPKVSNAERCDRFVALTQQIAVLDQVKNFEKAFQKAFKNALENAPAGHRTNRPGWRRRVEGE